MVSLPDDDVEVFRLYLNLMYTNQLATKGPKELQKLCRLFVLAEKLQDQTAKNHIIDGMHAFFHQNVLTDSLGTDVERSSCAEAIKMLYEGTPENSQARKLVVDLYADCKDESWLREGKTHLPQDFIFDIATRLLRKRVFTMFSPPFARNSSHYHEGIVPEKGLTEALPKATLLLKSEARPEKVNTSPKNLETAPKSKETKPKASLIGGQIGQGSSKTSETFESVKDTFEAIDHLPHKAVTKAVTAEMIQDTVTLPTHLDQKKILDPFGTGTIPVFNVFPLSKAV